MVCVSMCVCVCVCVCTCVLTMQAILWEVHIQHEVIIVQLSGPRRVQVVQDILRTTKITGNTHFIVRH